MQKFLPSIMPAITTRNYQDQKNSVIRAIKRNQFETAHSKLTNLLQSHSLDYDLHYIAGMLYGAQFRYDEAIKSFEEALRLHPKHAKSYFELGIIQMMLCRFNKASAYLQKAKVLKYNLSLTNSYLQKIQKIKRAEDVTLSACLIVKNEHKNLPTCLKSIQVVADEIVVVDTGSEDRTIEIAESFGAKIVHFKWQQDFAAARNFAKQHATSDWILQIDADEELFPEDQIKVRDIIHQSKCHGAFLEIRNRTSSMFGENQPIVHYLIRLFRNQKEIYYVNPIHETLEICGKTIPTDIKLLHHGYNLNEEYLKKKRVRNAEILHKRLRTDPDDCTTLFYLSMLHLGNQEFDLSEKYAHQILDKLNAEEMAYQHIYLMSLKNLALINVEKKNYKDARAFCERAIKINRNYLEPQFFRGLSYYREKNYQKSKECFQRYLHKYKEITQGPVFNLFAQSSHAYLFQIYYLLGKMYRKDKKYALAQNMMKTAVKLNPDFWIGFVDLGYVNLDLHDFRKAAMYLEHAINLAKKNPAVNKNNQLIWFDFMNAVKNYMIIIKKLSKEKEIQTA
ncbi:MAG: tetratricopeptide repeat protein [bacterium]